MKRQSAIGLAFLTLSLGSPCLGAETPKNIVVHAGQLFDGKSDRLASKQVIVIHGDRIVEVGPEANVNIPAGAEEIDLRTGTVLPGLTEGHNHMFKVEDRPGGVHSLRCPRKFGGSK
jgi:imidazolonepropionase-like amidohydrolase